MLFHSFLSHYISDCYPLIHYFTIEVCRVRGRGNLVFNNSDLLVDISYPAVEAFSQSRLN